MTIPTEQELFDELNEHNDFFEMLVEMIPSKLYISGRNNSTSSNNSNTGSSNDKTTTMNNGIKKSESKPAITGRNRFYKTSASDTKESRHAEAKLTKRKNIIDTNNDKELARAKLARTELNDNKDGTTPITGNGMKDGTNTSTNDIVTTDTTTSLTSDKKELITSRIEALREKLHIRLEKIRSTIPKKKDEISKRKQRLQEKIQRREDALRNKKKMQKQEHQQQRQNGDGTMDATSTTTTTVVTPDATVDLQTIDYGIIGGLNPTATNVANVKNYTAVNKSLANVKKPKNLDKLLSEAQAKQQKIATYKQSSNPDDKKKLDAIQWADTLKEADGIRIKEDPVKLKKAIARKVAKKKKSTKSWQSRIEQQSSAAKEKQAIRKHNLDARKVGGKIGSNLSKKRIITADDKKGGTTGGKGRSRPGFEGKKQGFLNSDSNNSNSKNNKKIATN